ncbi:MAG: hypothetical protein V1855_03295 [bacterium]
MVPRLEQLIEQTAFLLDMQKKAKKESSEIFTGLLKFLEEKINSPKDKEAQKILENIHDMLSGHAQDFTDQAQEDVDYLQENLGALDEIKKINDPKKAHEMLRSMIEDDEELPETADFKESVMGEYLESKKNLLEMIDEIKELVSKGDIEQVKLLIEAFLSEYEASKEHACCGQECDDCSSLCSEDIFAMLKEDDFEDDEEENKKGKK